MMKHGLLGWIAAAVGAIATSAPTHAEFVTWEVTGEVVEVLNPSGLLSSTIGPGSRFFVRYTFDSDTPDSEHSLPWAGQYRGALREIAGSLDKIALHGPLGGGDILVDNNVLGSRDNYAVLAYLQTSGIQEPIDFFLNLRSANDSLFASDALPVRPPALDALESTFFQLGTQSESFQVQGRITTIIPEPGCGVLLLGMLALVALRRRRAWSVNPPILVGALALMSVSASSTQGADCNHNGVEDAAELSSCPSMDVVFLIDNSGSIPIPTTSALCVSIDAAITALMSSPYNLTVNVDTRTIGLGSCTCCDDIGGVRGAYCNPDPLGLCATFGENCELGEREDWARAVSIVARNKAWGSGARHIIPIVDEGPKCGLPVNDPGDDRDAINEAISYSSANGVIVSPIVVSTGANFERVLTLAQALAEGAAPGGRVFADPTLPGTLVGDLTTHINRVSCPKDCNGNGRIDFCDIDDGTSPDCHAAQSNCCRTHAQPGCDNPTTQSCVCVDAEHPECCSGPWTLNCVTVAQTLCFACGLTTSSDRIPDECEAMGNCNENALLDDCDLNCGPPNGLCDVPGCGSAPDCNGNCIPDSCDIASCSGDPSCADCNGNQIPDFCDILSGERCDENLDGVPDECAACCVDFLCENRKPSECAGTAYPGSTCAQCGCSLVTCCDHEACRNSTNQLVSVIECECVAHGWSILPSSPACSSSPCSTGACCTSNGTCSVGAQGTCTAVGSSFLGGITSCTPNPCPQPASCTSPVQAPLAERQPCSATDCQTANPLLDCACKDHDSCGADGCTCETDADCKPLLLTTPSRTNPAPGKCIAGMCYVKKNRYISFIPRNTGVNTALRVKVVSSPVLFAGGPYWVGPPTVNVPDVPSYPFTFARLQCNPDYRDWAAVGLIQVADDEIVPSEKISPATFLSESIYEIQALPEGSDPCDETAYSCPLTLPTARWGDVTAGMNPAKDFAHPPDGIANFTDVAAIVAKFQGKPESPRKPMSDIAQQCPMPMNPVNFLDATASQQAFQSKRFPYYNVATGDTPWTPIPLLCGTCGPPPVGGGSD